MHIYLAVFIMMSFYGKIIFNKGISKNYKIIFLTFNLIIFGTIECLRDFTIGEDTINYINWFIDYSKAGWTNSLYHPTRDVEIGYKVLNLLIAEFTQNPRILLVIVNIRLTFMVFKCKFKECLAQHGFICWIEFFYKFYDGLATVYSNGDSGMVISIAFKKGI